MQVEATEKDELLTAMVRERSDLLHEKDELENHLMEARKELQDAYHTIANQEEQVSLREIKWNAYKKHLEDQLESERQHSAELEAHLSALEQQRREAEMRYKRNEERVSLGDVQSKSDQQDPMDELDSQHQYKQKIAQQKMAPPHSKAEDGTVPRTRELNLNSSTLSEKPARQEMEEPSAVVAKFILGVVLVSVLVGVFLGKRC